MKTQIAFAILALFALTLNAGQATTIRQIDFDNFRYLWTAAPPTNVPSTWSWLTSAPNSQIATVNGLHRFHSADDDNDPLRSPALSVDSVVYGDLDGAGAEEAVVALNYTSGGTTNWDYVYVYKLDRANVTLLARMQTGSRADGGLVRTFVRHGLLVIDFADADKRVGDCCSEGYIRVSYRWQDGAFVEEGERGHGKIDLEDRPATPRVPRLSSSKYLPRRTGDAYHDGWAARFPYTHSSGSQIRRGICGELYDSAVGMRNILQRIHDCGFEIGQGV